jgi:hypothetical protein
MPRLTKNDVSKFPLWARRQIEEQLKEQSLFRPITPEAIMEEYQKPPINCLTTIRLRLPIYWECKGKKPVLVGMNWYRNAHYYLQNKVKKHYHELVRELLKFQEIYIFDRHLTFNRCRVSYVLWYKNPASDMMNVVACLDKFILDALQKLGNLDNDAVKNYDMMEARVGGRDRLNPRLEVEARLTIKPGGEAGKEE